MKMMGRQSSPATKYCCNSRPVIPGSLTSSTKHRTLLRHGDRRNCSADENVCTLYPTDLSKLSVASHNAASSSTIAIIRAPVLPFPALQKTQCAHVRRSQRDQPLPKGISARCLLTDTQCAKFSG